MSCAAGRSGHFRGASARFLTVSVASRLFYCSVVLVFGRTVNRVFFFNTEFFAFGVLNVRSCSQKPGTKGTISNDCSGRQHIAAGIRKYQNRSVK